MRSVSCLILFCPTPYIISNSPNKSDSLKFWKQKRRLLAWMRWWSVSCLIHFCPTPYIISNSPNKSDSLKFWKQKRRLLAWMRWSVSCLIRFCPTPYIISNNHEVCMLFGTLLPQTRHLVIENSSFFVCLGWEYDPVFLFSVPIFPLFFLFFEV